MKYPILFVLFFLIGKMYANSDAYEKMLAVNAQWQFQQDVNHNALPKITSENHRDLIQNHLVLVEQQLRNRSTTHLTESQISKRKEALDYLKGYAASRAFPINVQYDYKTPIFIDPFDNFCAVGYLVKATGFESVSRNIASMTNLAYVMDMNYPELDAWAKEYGFTKAELAWIQPCYESVQVYNLKGVSNGVNGIVNTLKVIDDQLYIGGTFTNANDIENTSAITVLKINGSDYEYEALGNGVMGNVKSIISFNEQVVICGQFSIDDASAPPVSVAFFEAGSWNALGCINGMVKELVTFEDELYAVGLFTICNEDGISETSNFAKWNGTIWENIAGIADSINTAIVYQDALYLGGYFTIDETIRNVAKWTSTTGFETFYVDIVHKMNDFEIFDGNLIVAGEKAMGDYTTNQFVILKLHSGSLEPFGFSIHTAIPPYIYELTTVDGELWAVGSFWLGGMCDHYNNVAKLVSNEPRQAYSFHTNNKTNALVSFNHKIFVGGDFVVSDYEEANGIGYFEPLPLSVGEFNTLNVSIFPNPTSHILNINNLEEDASIKMFNVLSQQIGTQNLKKGDNQIDIRAFSNGSYFYEITNSNGVRVSSQFQVLK